MEVEVDVILLAKDSEGKYIHSHCYLPFKQDFNNNRLREICIETCPELTSASFLGHWNIREADGSVKKVDQKYTLLNFWRHKHTARITIFEVGKEMEETDMGQYIWNNKDGFMDLVTNDFNFTDELEEFDFDFDFGLPNDEEEGEEGNEFD